MINDVRQAAEVHRQVSMWPLLLSMQKATGSIEALSCRGSQLAVHPCCLS